MDHQTFLGKYQVASAPEGAASTARGSSSGSVFRGQELESGRAVAVEVLPANTLSETVRGQLQAEAEAAKQLSHPNIPALYDFGFEGENLIYVSEDVDGTTLETWVSEHGPMETGAALRVALQILSALGAAAYQRILHHAINPRNVLIVPGTSTDGGWPLVKLLNLIGLAPTAGSAPAIDGVSDNSGSFASPEQLQTGAVDFRSEIYSLGCTLFYLLTGGAPFQNSGETPDARVAATQRAIERMRSLPKDARRLLGQMLSANPDERPLDPLATHNLLQGSLLEVERNPVRAPATELPMIPPPPASFVDSPVARGFPVKALVIAAVVLALGTMAALVLPDLIRRSGFGRSAKSETEIGVPVGVPERSASPALAAESGTPRMPVHPATEESPTEEVATLTSTTGRVDASGTSRAASSTPASAPPAEPEQPSPAEVARTEVATPAPLPQETPAAELPSPAALATATPEIAARTTSTVRERDEERTATPVRAAKAATTPVPVRRAEPVTDADLAKVPRGAVGARYLGTDSRGNWIMELPSEKQGVVKLPKEGDAAAERRARRRVRRAEAVTEPTDEATPRVLKALPPDE